MTNDELKKILKWAQKREAFTWNDLQKQFAYNGQKMIEVQHTLRSNMPQSENLTDHRYVSGEDPNLLSITAKGRNTLSDLENQRSSFYNFLHNPWVVGIGILILSLILAYYLGLTT